MSRTTEILEDLVGFDTTSANSNLEMVAYIEAFLRARGFSVHRLPDTSRQKAGLFAMAGPAGDGILLSGHTDVVPATGQQWHSDPFRLVQSEDRLIGRGTTDMKGYLACMLSLAERAGLSDLNAPLKLVFSYDEEVGCVGIRDMLADLQKPIGRPRACIVGEPTDMRIGVGHKGKVVLSATCFGQSGHSALAPGFVNALHLASGFVNGLQDCNRSWRQPVPGTAIMTFLILQSMSGDCLAARR